MAGAIVTEGLTRSYGSTLALDHLDLVVEQGEIFGFMGPNRAGKSTTIRILLDLIRPDAGRAAIMGFDCQRQSVGARRRCGYLAGEFRTWPGLTGRATVELVASMRGGDVDMTAANVHAERLRLDLGRKAGEYSNSARCSWLRRWNPGTHAVLLGRGDRDPQGQRALAAGGGIPGAVRRVRGHGGAGL
jgi:ABC-2 type transport system ATP-binding protein